MKNFVDELHNLEMPNNNNNNKIKLGIIARMKYITLYDIQIMCYSTLYQ